MPSWTIYALAVGFFWGIANIMDTIILSRYKLSPWIYLALDGLLGIFPVILFIYISPFSIAESAIIYSVSSGVFVAIFNILYFRALKTIDVSVVTILIQITPVFSLLWGLSLLGESYNPINYMGMSLILIGTIIASSSEIRTGTKETIRRTILTCGIMLIATFSLSIAYLAQKLALNDSPNVLVVFGWQRASLFVISLLIILMQKREMLALHYQPVVLTFVVEVIIMIGFLFITLAYSIAPLSEVVFLASLQPAWVLIILWIFQIANIRVFSRLGSVSTTRVTLACGLVILGLYYMTRL